MMNLKIILIVTASIYCFTLSSIASGRYNEIISVFPKKIDVVKYRLGKEILMKSVKYKNKESKTDLNNHNALDEISAYLNKRKIKTPDILVFKGKLNENEFFNLVYYLKTRYRIHKL